MSIWPAWRHVPSTQVPQLARVARTVAARQQGGDANVCGKAHYLLRVCLVCGLRGFTWLGAQSKSTPVACSKFPVRVRTFANT